MPKTDNPYLLLNDLILKSMKVKSACEMVAKQYEHMEFENVERFKGAQSFLARRHLYLEHIDRSVISSYQEQSRRLSWGCANR